MASPAAAEPQPQPEPQPVATQALFALPADVQLLDYLRQWIVGGDAAAPSWIREADVYGHHPAALMLPAAATTAADGGVAWFYFTKLRRLGPHDPCIRRAVGGGTWRIEHDEPLASELDDVPLLGVKRSLSFGVRGDYGKFDRSGHLMHEYVLGDDIGHVPQGELALSVIYHTPRGDDLAVARAVENARQRLRMAEEKKAARSQRHEAMAAAKAAKMQESLAAREASKASKAQRRASLKAAAAAAIRAAKALPPPAPPASAPALTAASTSKSPAPAPPASAFTPASTAASTSTKRVLVPKWLIPRSRPSLTPRSAFAKKKTLAATSSASASTPSQHTDALPAKGKKRAAAAAAAAASKELKRALATASSATGNAPPTRLLLLHVGIADNKVYNVQEVEDGPQVKPVDCTGWVLLDPQTKDKMSGGPCGTV